MTLNDQLLRSLAEWRPTGPRQTLSVTHPGSGWTVAATAESTDTVGARLWEVHLVCQPAFGSADLAAWAEAAAGRVAGLLEPLRRVEVEGGVAAQLRSAVPARRGDSLAYYEVLRRAGGETTLRRYQAQVGGGPREQVAFNLTHEALAQVAAELAG